MAQQQQQQRSDGAAAIEQEVENTKKNRIQVSNTKKPLFFYVNLAKRFMQQYEEVELSALGMAISTVVTVVEILKNNGLAIVKNWMGSSKTSWKLCTGQLGVNAKGGQQAGPVGQGHQQVGAGVEQVDLLFLHSN